MDEYNAILEHFLQEDTKQAFTPSQTRLFLLLLTFAKERANERGYFPISIEELCQRYGTKDKIFLRKIRKQIFERGFISYNSTNGRLATLYTFRNCKNNRNKNLSVEAENSKEMAANRNNNLSVNGNKNLSVKSGKFEALTPIGGSVYFTTQEGANQARAFFYSCCNKLQNKEPQKVDEFFRFWVTENEDGKLKLSDKGSDFDILKEYEKY